MRNVLRLLLIMIVIAIVLMGCSEKEMQVEDINKNDSAEWIASLSSDVNTENMKDYDFTSLAMEYLEYIGQNLANRDLDGAGDNNMHDAAQDWIISELIHAGYSMDQIEKERFEVNWSEEEHYVGHNIILTVKGEDPTRQIIAGAHYDGSGLGDNGSGMALLLANAVGMKDATPHYTLKFIFFDGEEIGTLGSEYNASHMSEEEVNRTIYMINMDSLAFGDYCNIYGGSYGEEGVPTDPTQLRSPKATEAYGFAADTAEKLGFKVWRTGDLDGYYAKNGTGPTIEDGAFYTNPWTPENPAPANNSVMSPSTLPASDHEGYMDRGIEYIYFEATNWFAESADDEADALSYTGYVETYDYENGEHGMFMNTEYDTWENLNKLYPGRVEKHYMLYSPLLSALLMVK